MNKYCHYKLLLLLLLISFKSYAGFHHAGKHFFLAMPDPLYWSDSSLSFYYQDNLALNFSSKYRATIQLHFFNAQAVTPSQTLTINPGEVVEYAFNKPGELAAITSSAYFDVEVIRNKCLEITSDSNIIVTVIQKFATGEDDGTELMPIDNQPKVTEFRLFHNPTSAWTAQGIDHYYMAGIASACDSTVLRITPSCKTMSHFAGFPFTIVLNKGETYALQSWKYEQLIGTKVEVLYSNINMPVSIISENELNSIDPGTCCGDAVMEQILPWNMGADTLIPISLMGKQNIMLLRIVSNDANNEVRFDNKKVATLNSGDHFDTLIEQALVVHASKPVGVVMFMPSGAHPGTSWSGDPDMVWSFPISQGIKESYFRFFGPVWNCSICNFNNILTIISHRSNSNNVLFDNVNIGSLFKSFPGDSLWQYAYVALDTMDTTMVHHIVSPQKVVAYFARTFLWGGYSYNLSDLSDLDNEKILDTVYKCAGSGKLLEAPFGTSFYKWSSGDTTAQVYILDSGHYQLSAHRITGCDDRTELYDFYVVDIPVPIISGDSTCINKNNGRLMLNSVDTTIFKYTWRSYSGDVLRERISNSGDTLINLFPGKYTIELHAPRGCDTIIITNLDTYPSSNADFTIDTIACANHEVVYHNLSSEQTGIWNFGDGTSIINSFEPAHTYYNIGKYTTTLVVENSYGCHDTAQQTIEVVAPLYLTLNASTAYVDPGDEIILTTTATQVYTVLAWLPENTFYDQHAYSQRVYTDSTVLYTVIGQSLFGCIDTASVIIQVNPKIFTPTAFSPNGDGINDYFHFLSNGHITIEDFKIFDRWGNLVWYSHGGDGEKGWDGTFKGIPMELGVYFYLYRTRLDSGKILEGKGEVTLIR